MRLVDLVFEFWRLLSQHSVVVEAGNDEAGAVAYADVGRTTTDCGWIQSPTLGCVLLGCATGKRRWCPPVPRPPQYLSVDAGVAVRVILRYHLQEEKLYILHGHAT